MPGRSKYLKALGGLRGGKSYDKENLTEANEILSSIENPSAEAKGLQEQVQRRLKAHEKQEKEIQESMKDKKK
jgi:hypothetical protein